MKAYNINFKGYSNVLSACDIPTPNGKRVSLITMRLNDEDGYRDLTELKKILQMQGYPLGNKNEDILTISYIDDTVNKKEAFYFNNKPMYWGDQLLQIEENFVPKIMSPERYKQERDIHMKQYTLMANLTSRLRYAKFDGEDKAIPRVIEKLHDTLGAILKDSNQAFNITTVACLKQFKFQDLAAAFNHGITETMNHFFKIR